MQTLAENSVLSTSTIICNLACSCGRVLRALRLPCSLRLLFCAGSRIVSAIGVTNSNRDSSGLVGDDRCLPFGEVSGLGRVGAGHITDRVDVLISGLEGSGSTGIQPSTHIPNSATTSDPRCTGSPRMVPFSTPSAVASIEPPCSGSPAAGDPTAARLGMTIRSQAFCPRCLDNGGGHSANESDCSRGLPGSRPGSTGFSSSAGSLVLGGCSAPSTRSAASTSITTRSPAAIPRLASTC